MQTQIIISQARPLARGAAELGHDGTNDRGELLDKE